MVIYSTIGVRTGIQGLDATEPDPCGDRGEWKKKRHRLPEPLTIRIGPLKQRTEHVNHATVRNCHRPQMLVRSRGRTAGKPRSATRQGARGDADHVAVNAQSECPSLTFSRSSVTLSAPGSQEIGRLA